MPTSTTSTTQDNDENNENELKTRSERDFLIQHRLEQLELDIEKGRKLIEEREAKRNAFLKKQNKHYCQIMWKQLANENNKDWNVEFE